jgi:hypothetical protein
MLILVDYKHPHGTVKEVQINGERWILKGQCNRCGECCRINMKCKYLKYEMIDGKKIAKCSIAWKKPTNCVLYPRDPYDPLPCKCTYYWEKIDGW